MSSVTPIEASKKWCPFARAVLAPDPTARRTGPYNRLILDEDYADEAEGVTGFATDSETSCISSRCMAWREVEHADQWAEWGVAPGDHVALYNAKLDPANRKPVRGYCGLAGVPR